jgi:hypothetical protein
MLIASKIYHTYARHEFCSELLDKYSITLSVMHSSGQAELACPAVFAFLRPDVFAIGITS